MIIEKIKVFFAKHKAIKLLLWLALLGGLLCFAWWLYQGSIKQYFKNIEINDTTRGIIGTLLGAIVGGCLSFFGTVYVSKKAQKAQSAVKRNNVIYKPLYNELNEIHQVILKENPYPHFIEYEKRQQTMLRHPQYTVWGRIKKDARYFEVPRKLIKLMERLYSVIEKYQTDRSIAIKELDSVYREELKIITGDEMAKSTNIADVLLSYVMTEKRPDNQTLIWNMQTDAENYDKLWYSLLEEACKNDKLITLKETRNRWGLEEQKVLELLATYIKLINVKYEGA